MSTTKNHWSGWLFVAFAYGVGIVAAVQHHAGAAFAIGSFATFVACALLTTGRKD